MAALALLSDFMCEKWKKTPFLVEDEVNIEGKTVLITGANSGIGKAAAVEFVKRGAVVVMACRDTSKAKTVIQEIRTEYPDAQLILIELDLADKKSIKKCSEEVHEKIREIHILINNAGCLYTSGALEVTKDGFEIHMGINFLGHFVLTNLLLDLLKSEGTSRIVIVGSSLHLLAELDMNDLMLLKRGYFGIRNFGPYANSKLALLYFATELSNRLKGSGVNVYTLCPGYVKTDAFRNESCFDSLLTRIALLFAGTSPEQACENIIYCATSKKISNESGKMYRFNKPWDTVNQNIAKFDNDVILSLWKMSEELTGSPFLKSD